MGNEERISHRDSSWPGSTHDGGVWNQSEIKAVVERQNRYCVVGDSGYAISEWMIKPFSQQEINAASDLLQRKMRFFNRRLSGARTEMTENVYGKLKRRWQILKNMTLLVRHALKAIKACAILHNICVDWNEEIPEDNGQRPDGPDAGNVVEQNRNRSDQTRKTRGKRKRLRLMHDMAFPF